MEDIAKVFSSDITRGPKSLQNNLYDLLNVVPAEPTAIRKKKEHSCDFQPKIDKYYTPKKRNKLKVKTIRDIRHLYEKDIYSYLPDDLEKQQNVLLKKITGGSSRDERTKLLANNLIKSQNPVSRSAWQMLMNLNPEAHAHCIQYVLWNGKRIRVNGSKGGKSKFLFNYDLAKKKVPLQAKSFCQSKDSYKKKGLLCNSLTVKFKPGPLTKKKFLDDSYQKYSVGNTELVHLPKPELDIQPTYGVVLEPTITNFIHSLREVDGKITKKWAEFAVSVLGTLNNKAAVQNEAHRSIRFDLNYNSNRRRILMRRDARDSTFGMEEDYNTMDLQPFINDDSIIISEVRSVINNMLDSVEISLRQDDMYSGEDDPREEFVYDNTTKDNANNIHTKDKFKRNTELNRLDVTVIRLPEVIEGDNVETCHKAHCLLGCICRSLQCNYKFKQHCGRIECMFECKCDFLKYKVSESLENDCSELLPGLLNLDNEINLRLAKEEQKFHQTVVVTGDKSVLLKSKKRNWKASKRYADFYCDMNLKAGVKTERVLSVADIKLNCENIEPWCMVHNLYQCFCKGRFTDSVPDKVSELKDINETIVHHEKTPDIKASVNDKEVFIRNTLRNRHPERCKTTLMHPERNKTNFKEFSVIEHSTSELSNLTDMDMNTCARLKPYRGRKYYDSYYFSTNKKILEMEKNDDKLHGKMMMLINNMENKEKSKLSDPDHYTESNHSTEALRDNSLNENTDIKSHQSAFDLSLPPLIDKAIVDDAKSYEGPTQSAHTNNDSAFNRFKSNLSTKTLSTSDTPNLISWLELNYKYYKERSQLGIVKMSLDPPKLGKMSLYPWEFILSRYKERKNLFLITKKPPFRVFMAVDAKNKFFENCINIDDIRFADLQKYPATAKNLLTNATDLKDNFCILRGLTHCWEWIGSANVQYKTDSITSPEKTLNHDPNLNEVRNTVLTHEENNVYSKELSCNTKVDYDVNNTNENRSEVETNAETSKWFVMTVENDFSEIQFNKRGFYVKYESIIKAINVANMSGKTVCLSSQKCTDKNSGPQFGIYAIPNATEYCVFVGPYDKEDPLGIEIVKSISDVRKMQRTRGVWITTKKVDNLKVIDNPLSFMPQNKYNSTKIVPFENDIPNAESTSIEHLNVDTDSTSKSNDNENINLQKSSKKDVMKIVKPIKIRKIDGFYHLASKSLLKQMTLNPVLLKEKQITTPGKEIQTQICLQNAKHHDGQNKTPLLLTSITAQNTLLKTSNPLASTSKNMISQQLRPVAEIAPQIKIVDVYSESAAVVNCNIGGTKKPEGGMFVLKPDEINKRLMQNNGLDSNLAAIIENDCMKFCPDPNMNQDIEDFLATSQICTLPNSDIYVISDDEEACSDHKKTICNFKEVWIECKSIENLGWLRGRRNATDELSFEFPGFKYTDFYAEEEALLKINQVLSRKIYVPKSLNLEWHVVESEEELKTKLQLKPEELGADFVLTKKGPRHKIDLESSKHKRGNKRKNVSEHDAKLGHVASNQKCFSVNGKRKMNDLLYNLEEQSKNLENEGNLLLTEFKKKGDVLRSLYNISDDQRQQVTETLQKIMLPFTTNAENELDINKSSASPGIDS